MKGVSHCVIGTSLTIAGLVMFNPIPEVNNYVAAGISVIPAAIASFLVDIDIERSKAGKRLRAFASKIRIVAFVSVLLGLALYLGLKVSYPWLIKTVLAIVGVAVVSWVLTTLEHRGPTHSLAIPGIFLWIWSDIYRGMDPYLDVLTISFLSGYTLHIMADMLNGKGCPLFWPISKSKINIMDLDYDGIGEKICCFLAVAVAFLSVVFKIYTGG